MQGPSQSCCLWAVSGKGHKKTFYFLLLLHANIYLRPPIQGSCSPAPGEWRRGWLWPRGPTRRVWAPQFQLFHKPCQEPQGFTATASRAGVQNPKKTNTALSLSVDSWPTHLIHIMWALNLIKNAGAFSSLNLFFPKLFQTCHLLLPFPFHSKDCIMPLTQGYRENQIIHPRSNEHPEITCPFGQVLWYYWEVHQCGISMAELPLLSFLNGPHSSLHTGKG